MFDISKPLLEGLRLGPKLAQNSQFDHVLPLEALDPVVFFNPITYLWAVLHLLLTPLDLHLVSQSNFEDGRWKSENILRIPRMV